MLSKIRNQSTLFIKGYCCYGSHTYQLLLVLQAMVKVIKICYCLLQLGDATKKLDEANKVIAGHEKLKEKLAKDLEQKSLLLEEQVAATQKVRLLLRMVLYFIV